MQIQSWVSAGALLVALSGCGAESDTSNDARGSEMATGGTSGATAGTGGMGVSGGSASSGIAHAIMFEEPGYQMSGISLTGDELELYYVRSYSGGAMPSVVRRTRPTTLEPFATPEYLPLPEVCAADQRVNPDVTDDGLSLYVTCTKVVEIGMSEGVSTLRVARRPDRSSAFALEPESVGGVFASAGISADELTAYTDGEIFDTAPTVFTRASKTERFGEPQPVPGITEPLNSPDISSDGLALFGSATPRGASSPAIFRALRDDPNGSFGAPEQLNLAFDQLFAAPAIGAPTITPSGTLYLIAAAPFSSYMLYAAALQ